MKVATLFRRTLSLSTLRSKSPTRESRSQSRSPSSRKKRVVPKARIAKLSEAEASAKVQSIFRGRQARKEIQQQKAGMHGNAHN